jgi:hypothetical protein
MYARNWYVSCRLCDRFQAESGWIFDASSWLFYTKLIKMHRHLNIKYVEGSVHALNPGIAVAYTVFASCSVRV